MMGFVIVCVIFASLMNVSWQFVADTCNNNIPAEHFELCHDQYPDMVKKSYKCPAKEQALVLSNLFVAPSSQYKECGDFFQDGLVSAECLRNLTSSFNTILFNILDTVSGKSEINSSSVVSQFNFMRSTDNDSSAFISFKKDCKPARPTNKGAINMCSKETRIDTRVYLTLQGLDQVPTQPSMCRCTITPDRFVHLKALDVRLQHFNGSRTCGPATSIEIKAENQDAKYLPCEDQSLWYGYDLLLTDTDGPVTLTLSHVSDAVFPTAVWIEVAGVDGGESKSWKKVAVRCEGFQNITELPPVTEENSDTNSGDKGSNSAAIIGGITGSIVGIIVLAVLVFFVRKRFFNEDRKRQENFYDEIVEDDPNSKMVKTQDPPALPDRLNSASLELPATNNIPPKPPRMVQAQDQSAEYDVMQLKGLKDKRGISDGQQDYDHIKHVEKNMPPAERKLSVRDGIKIFEEKTETKK